MAVTTEQYIEHEVKLRVNDEKFLFMRQEFSRMENKLNWLIGLVVSGFLIPMILHVLKLV